MMRAIKRLVYRLGFRPNRGSIFYSPSLDWLIAARDAARASAALWQGQAMPHAIRAAVALEDQHARRIHEDVTLSVTRESHRDICPDTDGQHEWDYPSPYKSSAFCIACGETR